VSKNRRISTMGAIVCLDIFGGSPYGIAAGSLFEANTICADGSGTEPCPESFAWRLGDTWPFSFDTVSSKLGAGDVGHELNVLKFGATSHQIVNRP
jgi:hypothetical protein